MSQTAKGFTYPDPNDQVMDLPAIVETFAEEVNDHVGRIAAGSVGGLVLGAAGTATAAVVFPAGRFSAPPVVVCNITSGYPAAGTNQNAFAFATAVTAAGFTMNYRRGAADTGVVSWVAVQV